MAVTNPDFGTVTSGSLFQVVTPTAVAITRITPNQFSQGLTNVPVDIYGTGFVSGATVTFSSSRFTPGTVTFIDSTHLQVLVSTNTSSAQSSSVTVTNPSSGGSYTATNGAKLSYASVRNAGHMVPSMQVRGGSRPRL